MNVTAPAGSPASLSLLRLPSAAGLRFFRAETLRACSELAEGPHFDLTFFEVPFQTQKNPITSSKLIILDVRKKGID